MPFSVVARGSGVKQIAPALIACRRDSSESVPEIGIIHVRIGRVRMVKGVHHIRFQLERHFLTQLESLVQPKAEADQTRSLDDADAAVAVRTGRGGGERSRVEPLLP